MAGGWGVSRLVWGFRLLLGRAVTPLVLGVGVLKPPHTHTGLWI